ncbi:hypothetical protein [Desulfofustis limnaeus]|jgi:hypothetical protein|uniref:Uncharacterized protein n=1 Tax=Desulfofustis limnaeus TaxID=2740163 RepID=A0ABM7WER0_9BACT|nr:hypothetical protein [Desulfofustis limnaeus]MDX9895950.1 hypothetical protein [Desulfofustis sp.]BDD89466.1 hypothetical protein DPPLL_38310 [Desulfofustis limnaeus]
MADREKKIAAALAAVQAYLCQEESEAAARTIHPEALPPPAPTFWSLSGRQEIMNMRRLIQMRTFTSLR